MSAAILPGDPEPLGLTLAADGANVAVVSSADAVDLLLYEDAGDEPTRVLRLPGRLGEVWHGFVPGLREGARYALVAHGPHAPERGLRFDPTRRLLDPYALQIDRPFRFGAPAPLAVAVAPEPVFAPRQLRPWDELTIYELNVRGFTARMESVPEGDRGTLRGLAHESALRHLVDLGVTAVELMPCAAWTDERHLPALGLANAWGYNPVALMAPDPRLAPGGWRDVAAATQALAAEGIETILDVVLNHTGESDEHGETLSLRGLDDALYYRRRADKPALYVNDAGTGAVLALDRPTPLRLALDALRAWAIYGGVSGFRFDLATTLARRDDGFDPAAPFLAAIRQDPILRGLRMIAEPWDVGPGGYQLGRFPAGWGEWNDQYRKTARRFWRGESGLVGEMATRLSGSQDLFGSKTPARSINYVVSHDGFTLADLVAYTRKRNAANGENNRDGADDEIAWNNGVEGDSDDAAIRADRARDQRALLATLIFSRGSPMLAMGAELGHSQGGNNNAYAQPALNEIDWSRADARLLDVARRCLALRRDHPALRADRFLVGAPPSGCETPDAQWLRPDGAAMRDGDWREARVLIVALTAATSTGCDRVLLALNPTREATTLTPPPPRSGFVWTRAFESSEEAGDLASLPARAVVLLVEESDPDPRRREGVDDALLDRVAQAAGVSPHWHEISGARHDVPPTTKRAVLAALGLEPRTAAQAREALRRLADAFDRRAMPHAVVARPGEPARLRAPGARVPRLTLSRDGQTQALTPLAIEPTLWRGRDGRDVEGLTLTLPPQPQGEATLARDDDEATATLLVADGCARRAGRFGGLAAQLYALRRAGDGGLGDFTTLAALAEGAGRLGLDVVGLNPLHALFPGDPERASPYSPSDRRRLDPLYVDLGRLAADLGVDAGLDPFDAGDARMVDYAGARAARRAGFARLYGAVRERLSGEDALGENFRAFVAEGGEPLTRFALWRALSAEHGENWRRWPAPLRDAEPGALAQTRRRLAPQVERALFEQWAADRQLAEAAARGRAAGLSLGLYRDLAVGAAGDGAEAWIDQSRLLDGLSIGAPPDPLGPLGQVWALPAPDPLAATREAGAAFGALIRENMRHAGALRIDHAFGLSRLFLVPDGATGAQGCYLAQPEAINFARLALESARADCLVVGEDLGTAPQGFHRRLEDAGALSYRVVWFEREGEGFLPPHAYPRAAAACVTTHDLPTLAGWWAGADIDERRALDLISDSEELATRAERQREKRALLDALRKAGALDAAIDPQGPYDPRLAVAAHAFVAATPATIALAQAEDCVGETVAVNLPGTDRERPNWRRRLDVDVAAILSSPALVPLLRRAAAPLARRVDAA